MENFNDLKKLYEDGYRCIYQDGSEGNRTIYLKNFDNEKSTVVNLQDENEFSQFQNYISGLRMSYKKGVITPFFIKTKRR